MISKRIDQFNQPTNSSKALQLVKLSDSYTFMSDSSQLQYDVSKDCQNLLMASEKFGPPSRFAFPVSKDSSLLPAVNLMWVTRDTDLTKLPWALDLYLFTFFIYTYQGEHCYI